MCVTCGCGGKKATVEELDQTHTHEHPHAEDGHVHRDSDQHRHHHDAAIMNTATPVLISTNSY